MQGGRSRRLCIAAAELAVAVAFHMANGLVLFKP